MAVHRLNCISLWECWFGFCELLFILLFTVKMALTWKHTHVDSWIFLSAHENKWFHSCFKNAGVENKSEDQRHRSYQFCALLTQGFLFLWFLSGIQVLCRKRQKGVLNGSSACHVVSGLSGDVTWGC